jgi:hypothetical protein
MLDRHYRHRVEEVVDTAAAIDRALSGGVA